MIDLSFDLLSEDIIAENAKSIQSEFEKKNELEKAIIVWSMNETIKTEAKYGAPELNVTLTELNEKANLNVNIDSTVEYLKLVRTIENLGKASIHCTAKIAGRFKSPIDIPWLNIENLNDALNEKDKSLGYVFGNLVPPIKLFAYPVVKVNREALENLQKR